MDDQRHCVYSLICFNLACDIYGYIVSHATVRLNTFEQRSLSLCIRRPTMGKTIGEPSRKGDRSTAMGHTHLQGRTRRERTLEAIYIVEDRNGQVGYAPAAFLVVILDTAEEEEESDATKKGLENSTEETRIGQEGERRKSYSAAVIAGIKRKSRIFVGDSIVRKTDTRLSKEEDVVVCLPGARIEHVTERVEKIMGRGKGGTILVHIGTNNADKEGTTAIVDKYRKLLKKTKEARVEQIILSGILPVFGNMIDGYRNSKRMAINGMVKRLCKEEDVGYVDLWDSFVGKHGMYARDGLHL